MRFSRFMEWGEAHQTSAIFIYLASIFIAANYVIRLALRNYWFPDGPFVLSGAIYVCFTALIIMTLMVASLFITLKERSMIPIFCWFVVISSFALPLPHHPSYPEQEDFAKNRDQYESLIQQTLELAHCGDGLRPYGIESACYFYEDNQRIIRVNPFTFWRYIVYVDQPSIFDQCDELIDLAQNWYLCVDKSYRDAMEPL